MELNKEIVAAIMDELESRRGFYGWWDGIDEDIQKDIILCLEDTVDGLLSGSSD